MQAKKSKKLKSRSKAPVRRNQRQKTRRPAPAELAQSHESILLKKLTAEPKAIMPRGLELQDIVYNSAAELRSLAFKSAYNIGAEAYRSSGRGGIASLEHLLEHAGFGKVIYHPFESMTTFTSYTPKANGQNLGLNIHVFETGLIAGYLSTHAGRSVGVQETACVFNGASHCMFIAKPGSAVSADAYRNLSLQEVISAFRQALIHAEKHKASKSYYMLAVRPLLNEPVLSEASKFLYLIGKLLVAQAPANPQAIISQASDFLKISSAKLSSDRKKDKVLSLSYDQETSSGRFIDLTTAFLSGLIKGAYGRSVRITRGLSSREVYNVRMEILQSTGKAQ